MNRVDLLMVRFPNTIKDEWANEAIESVKNEPVNFTILPGIHEGPITQRLEFMKTVSTPYFGWIDDDDKLIPGTITKCIKELDNDVEKKLCGVLLIIKLWMRMV